ncbi:MAG: helix-turn-helix transcriptional regulator, partial [Actinomycetota bacterium]
HWADRSTRDLLTFLAAGLRSSAMLFVGTYRTDALVPSHPLHGWLGELLRNRDAELIELPRLTEDEIRLQLTSILGGPPRPDVVAAVWARSEGNAFFAEELLAALISGQDDLPATLRQVLLARLGLLSPAAARVLSTVAITGSPVRHELLFAVGSLPEADLEPAVRECVDRQDLIVDARGDGYAFRHNLLREAVLGELLPGERVRLHRASAQALAANPTLAHGLADTELALHWAAAGEPEQAVPASLRAAEVTEAAYAFAEACRHLQRALDLWPHAPRATLALDRLEVTLRAAELANLGGEHELAVALAREATSSLDTPQVPATRAAAVWERLGQFLWDSGLSEDALVAHARAADLIESEPEGQAAARVLSAQATAQMLAGRYSDSRATATSALALARATGARREEVRVLAVLGFDLAYLGHEGGVRLLHEARTIAEEDADLDGIARSFIHLATLLSEPLNLLEEALTIAAEGLQRLRQIGLERSHGVALQAFTVNVLFRLGRWSEADQALQDAFARDPGGTAAIDLRLARIKIAMGRGDFATAAADLKVVKARSSRAIDPRFQAPLLTLEAGLALWEGRLGDAREAVADGMARLAVSRELWFAAPLAWHGLRAEADRARGARMRDAGIEVAEAGAVADALIEQLRALTAELDPGASAVHRAAALYRAMCDGERSRIDGNSSAEVWEAAAAGWDDMGQPYPAAYCRLRQAEALLARQTRSSAAAVALRAAHEAASRMGADPLRWDIEALAGRAMIKLTASSPAPDAGAGRRVIDLTAAQSSTPRPDSPPDSPPGGLAGGGLAGGGLGKAALLSARELDVLVLVAQGRTNREIAEELFIAPKTVSAHISHILVKLEVRSRVEAAGYAHRLGLTALQTGGSADPGGFRGSGGSPE